jgi:pyruvate/2-oxoglutarate dehydrogenase complex dihydrolipoamide acyltransferase (E2) component
MAKVPVYMPKYGMTMTEGVIVEWFFAAGEAVTQGTELLTVETEKVNTTLECPATGTLAEIRFSDGESVAVGEIIAYIETDS